MIHLIPKRIASASQGAAVAMAVDPPSDATTEIDLMLNGIESTVRNQGVSTVLPEETQAYILSLLNELMPKLRTGTSKVNDTITKKLCSFVDVPAVCTWIQQKCIPRLINQLRCDNIRHHYNAVRALAHLAAAEPLQLQIGTEGSIPIFIRMLSSDQQGIRWSAANVIARLLENQALDRQIGTPACISSLACLLDLPHKHTVRNAASALSKLAGNTQLRSEVGVACLPKMMDLLHNAEDGIQLNAAYALANLVHEERFITRIGEQCIVKLIELLHAENLNSKWASRFKLVTASALGSLAKDQRFQSQIGENCIPRLIKLLESENQSIRDLADLALVNLGVVVVGEEGEPESMEPRN